MKKKTIKILKKEELEKMHTGSLMSRRTQLLRCEESEELSDLTEEEKQKTEKDIIKYKQSELWKIAYSQLKEVLAKREHYKK